MTDSVLLPIFLLISEILCLFYLAMSFYSYTYLYILMDRCLCIQFCLSLSHVNAAKHYFANENKLQTSSFVIDCAAGGILSDITDE
jgi:hypothetical protein